MKRAKSNAPTIKRAESIAPLSVNPQYGEVIPTPRQQGAQARRKPVLVDMDSEDEMIWNMKNVGYKDEPVAAELVKLGKIHYDPKTIATRYSRIKKTQHAYEEQILDEDFSDYHEQEVSDHLYERHVSSPHLSLVFLLCLLTNDRMPISKTVSTKSKHPTRSILRESSRSALIVSLMP